MQTQDETTRQAILHREAGVPPRSLSHWLIGRPLSTADAPHQTIGKAVGLAVFASDALSSTAYATQEILVILAVAGTAAFGSVYPRNPDGTQGADQQVQHRAQVQDQTVQPLSVVWSAQGDLPEVPDL